MKILKKILLVIIGIFALLLIIAAFSPKKYAVEREVEINKSKAQVFSYILFLENQDTYSVWAQMDPNAKKEFRGTDGKVGFVSAWESEVKEVGKGEQEITGIIDGERIDYVLRFMEPFEATDYAYMETKSVSDSTTNVVWGFNGKMPYPMNIMMLWMNMEEMLGPDLEKGLQNLKSILEN